MLTNLCSISEEPHNKTPKEVIAHLHEFISTLPVHPSHYTRGKAPMRQYMDQHCTIKSLFDGYVFHAEVKGFKPVRSDKFRKVFNDQYNIVPRLVV